ncbi:hypothetical protein KBD71_02695 [Candidatus Woesebacteria bacterium]|nr:hypothetical protein [Candidatus Woesebacteria bacterium]
MLTLLSQVDLGNSLKTGQGTRSVGSVYPNLASFLNIFVPLAFIIAGLLFLFLLIGGGFAIIASGGNAKNMEQGKNQIVTAVLGLVVIFAAYWIVQIIELFTGVQIFNSTL